MLDVTQISANEYLLEEIVKDEISEEYVYTDDGEILIASNIFDSEKVVRQLLSFLFRNDAHAYEIYRNDLTIILELSEIRKQLISFNQLESSYQDWLVMTGRQNTMDEYGMMLDYIGHANCRFRSMLTHRSVLC